MPLIVRNTTTNPVVFAKKDVAITWSPRGDRSSQDVQMTPDSLAEDMDFLNTVRRGTLVVEQVSDPSLTEKMERLLQFTSRTIAAPDESAAIEGVLDRRQQRDIVGRPCIGPDERGNEGKCGNQVLTLAAQTGEEPPLCSVHQHLVDQFYLVEEGSKGEGGSESQDGVITRTWKRPTMTTPVRG